MSRIQRLKRMLNPSRVAWLGGSGIAPAVDYMQANGFSGQAIAVNPKRDELAGLDCFRTVADIPFEVDLAILLVPGNVVIDAVKALSEKDCGGVICISSGFSESGSGEHRQSELVEAAGDMPVIGPNCPGIANFLDGNAFMMDHFGNHSTAKGVAVISNGGAYLSDLGCADRSQPIAYLVGLGNQAMVSIADMLDVVLDDHRVTSVNIYFESITEVSKLSRAAAKAAHKGIPVVAIKGGKSAVGKRAAQSHTASLAGDATLASALFQRFGWIEVASPSEAIETVKMLTFTRLPTGRKTGFITSSGSYAVIGADIAENLGLDIAAPYDNLLQSIDEALPNYVSATNPLDISDAHGWPYQDQLKIYQSFAQHNYDLFAQVMCYPPENGWDMTTWDTTTSALAEAVNGRPVAFVNTLAEALPVSARQQMISQGMAPLQGLEDGLRAVFNAATYGASRNTCDPDSMVIDSLPGPSTAPILVKDEHTAKSLLKEAGLDLPNNWKIAYDQALPEIHCQCVLKALVPGLIHKTEIGAVELGIQPDDLAKAMDQMKAHLKQQEIRCHEFLVEEMINDAVAELMVGIRRVPEYGLSLTLATGGIAVELIHDSVTILLPAKPDQIKTALFSLGLAPLLSGYRGRRIPDHQVVLDTLASLCKFVQNQPDIMELEINPLLLTENRAVIVDTVMRNTR